MDGWPEKICHYFYIEECPHQFVIARSILIPQLLDPAELESVRKVCQACEKCRGERRTNRRIMRTLRATVDNGTIKNLEGTIGNINSTGALITLNDCPDFKVGEHVDIKIYYDVLPGQTKEVLRNQSCIIMRIAEQGHQLAVMFLNENK